jgi:DNA-binding transcriptional LysR family regulator
MALGGLDLNLLVILQALLEEGNLTRAGMRVGIPQPAMSIALARLRRHFKDELLLRSGNEYVLTPLARSLLPSVQESVRLIGRAFSPEEAHSLPPSGQKFAIGLSDYSIVVFGELLLSRVRELAPDVSIEVQPLSEGLPGSRRGPLQHDLLVATAGFWPGGRPEVICRDRFVCVVDPANPRLRDGRLSLADLAAMPHAVARKSHAELDKVGTELERHGITPTIAMTTTGWLPLPFVVAGTDMVAAVPERLARRVSQAARVTVTPPPFGEIEFVEVAWWHPVRATDPALAWLRGVLSEIAASQQLHTPTPRKPSNV